MMPEGESENDNALVMRCFNALDHYADMTGAGIAVVHHSSKGSQSGKRATDVGSGAGSMSRAADTHLVLREHEETNCAVLDAALRSWKPIEPVVLRWTFPVWNIDDSLNPDELKGVKSRGEEQQGKRDNVGIQHIVEALREMPDQTRTKLAENAGMGIERLNRIIAGMKRDGTIRLQPARIRGNDTEVIRLADDDRPPRFPTCSGAPEDVPEDVTA
jgi:hypothetical protein